MLIMSSTEYRPSYDQYDIDPYLTRCYNKLPTTLEMYFGDGNKFEVQKIDAHLCITSQGVDNRQVVETEMDISADQYSDKTPTAAYKEILELLKSGDYTADEMKIVIKNPSSSTIYAFREI